MKKKYYNLHRIPHHIIRFFGQMMKRTQRKCGIFKRIKNLRYIKTYIFGRCVANYDEEFPWLNYELCAFLCGIKRGRVIEFGSGRSTSWLAKQGFKVLSIEHQKDWAKKVSARLKAKTLNKAVDLKFVKLTGDPKKNLQSYFQPVHYLARNEEISFVLVDGIFRNECLDYFARQRAIPNCIILHDSDWPDYQPAINRLIQSGRFRLQHIFGPGYGTPDFTWATIFERV